MTRNFLQHFPNLDSLILKIETRSSNEVKRFLSQTLPYVTKLKSFDLVCYNNDFDGPKPIVFALDVCDSIFDLSQLEFLSITFDHIDVQSMDLFLNKLVVCHPQLQQIYIRKYNILLIHSFC